EGRPRVNLRLRARSASDRLESTAAAGTAASPARSQRPEAEVAYQNLKLRLHRQLIERIDFTALARLDISRANAELRTMIRSLIDETPAPLSQRDRGQLAEEILNEVNGLGPIEPLMRDPE